MTAGLDDDAAARPDGPDRPQRDVPPADDPAATDVQPLEIVVVTGLSGAGKLSAGRVLEDLGWFVVDNLPPALLQPMVELGARGDIRRFAAVVDVRSRAFSSGMLTSTSAPTSAAAGRIFCSASRLEIE